MKKKTTKILSILTFSLAILFFSGIVASQLLKVLENRRLDAAIEYFYDPEDPERLFLSFYSLYQKERYKDVVKEYPEMLKIFDKLKLQELRYTYFIMLDSCKKIDELQKRDEVFAGLLDKDPAYGYFLHASEIYETDPEKAKEELIFALEYKENGKGLDPEWTEPAQQLLEVIQDRIYQKQIKTRQNNDN